MDIMRAGLFVIAIILIGETILPGIISNHISPVLLYAKLFAICIIVAYMARTQGRYYMIQKTKMLPLLGAYVFFIALVGLACFRYGIFFGSMMIICMTLLFFALSMLYKHELHRS
ncbi:MAG: hypothetical protein WC819_00110 [Parcubacteria group bacterium]|jgi:hypothetical protein